MDDWTPAAAGYILSKVGASPSYALLILPTGFLRFDFWSSGVNKQRASTAAVPGTDGADLWIRVTLDVDNGAGGHDVKFYTSTDGKTWSQLGATVTTAGTTSIDAGTATLNVGAEGAFPIAAKVYRGQVLDGIDGTTVLDIDTSLTAGSATSFTATTGQTVTIGRATSGRKTVNVVTPCWLFGTDDYMEVADNALLDFTPADSITVLAVIREWATPTSGGRLVAKMDEAAPSGWRLQNNSTNLAPIAVVADGLDSANSGTSATFPAGAATVVGFALDRSTATVKPFVGSTINSGSSASAIGTLANSATLRIGRGSLTSIAYQNFELLAVAVFRRALSAEEIASLATYYASRWS